MIFLLLFILIFAGYSILIIYYWQIWKSIPDFAASEETSFIPVSIIIPARNEEENIGQLLQALHEQTYPKEFIEIIVVNDHSTDATAQIAMQFPGIKLVNLQENEINSYKKKAVEKGISVASGSLVITTDADCIPPPGWVQAIVSFKESSKAVFVVAPVVIDCNSDIVQVFQAMDFMVLQGITGASVYKKIHSMCNGANLAYERKVFYEVDGFAGIDHIASGDDMLLMHKVAKKYPGRLYYLKSTDAIVSTQPMTSWSSFFNQRIRWASKALYYNDKRIFWILLLVYLFNLSFLVLLLAGWWNHLYWIFFLMAWMAKTVVELPLFYSIAGFFRKQWAVKWFFFFQPIHIFYTIISGLFGQFGKYEWKGRKVK